VKKFIIISIITFTIVNVMAAITNDATLGWAAPMKNIDGSPLEDLDGFNLYAQDNTNFVHGENVFTSLFEGVNPVPIPSFTNEEGEIYGDVYSIDVKITTGMWYTATALDFAGNESAFSDPWWSDVTAPRDPTNVYFTLGW